MRTSQSLRLAICLLGFALPGPSGAADRQAQPVIDMHVHASRLKFAVPLAVCPGDQPLTYPAIDPAAPNAASANLCDRPLLSATTTDQIREQSIEALRRSNVRRAMLAGPEALVVEWMTAAPGLFIPAAVPEKLDQPSLAKLQRQHEVGRAKLFAELGTQYLGISADDSRLEGFWSLAERLDVPVGIHLGEGVPGQAEKFPNDKFRVSLTSPFQLEEVLHRHLRLRVYVMHNASPLVDEMIGMLFTYSSLYVDVAANDWNMPRAQFYDQLKRLVDAGFSKRIMFGSDQTIWPQGIELAIRTINEAPFLNAEQRRDILYNNAARFLRLSSAEIASDHRPLDAQQKRAEPKPRP